MHAARLGHTASVDALLDAGYVPGDTTADLFIKDHSGRDAYVLSRGSTVRNLIGDAIHKAKREQKIEMLTAELKKARLGVASIAEMEVGDIPGDGESLAATSSAEDGTTQSSAADSSPATPEASSSVSAGNPTAATPPSASLASSPLPAHATLTDDILKKGTRIRDSLGAVGELVSP
eukprot:3314533-Prymnesium_polylepis.1